MNVSAPAHLAVRGLTKRYGGLVAVNQLDFDVRSGEIVALVGPNGSGKSTVMQVIMGLTRPTAGSIRLDGVEIGGLPAHQVARRKVGLVFQHSRPLHRQSVLENIELALLPDNLLQLFAAPEVERRAREVAARVGLQHVLDRRPSTLPFADLRRLEMARAIARDPRVVLIDEPFAGLTPSETATLAQVIETFRDEGRAVLLIDHNVKSVAALADRVVALHHGERIAAGTPAEVMADETVRRVYLGGSLETAARAPRAVQSGSALLQVRDASVFYGKAQALDQVAIDVHEGEFVSIVGLNGAGKTTLFNAISGLVPASGRFRWAGKPLVGSPARIARNGIVQCPETRELFGEMSVRENLDLGGQHFPARESAQQLAWLFELFPVLSERPRQTAATLSGGEQQMLAIARALMTQPRLLILDEPTLGLAPVILQQLARALETLRARGGISVLLGEQNVTFALPHADRVYVLEFGHISWEGPASRFAAEAGAQYV
jgi:ABC-type branched-subunit amino acid transport system ATPase component